MFDRLIDLVIKFITLFQCFTYVNDFEMGVILRKGVYHRTVGPGLRWLIPGNVESIISENIRSQPLYLDVQSFETKDRYAANMQIGIIWRITDVRTFLLANDETAGIVSMLCSGVVTAKGQCATWAELKAASFPDTLKAPMNRKVRKKGAAIETVIVQDFAHGSADRLWHEGISFSLGEE